MRHDQRQREEEQAEDEVPDEAVTFASNRGRPDANAIHMAKAAIPIRIQPNVPTASVAPHSVLDGVRNDSDPVWRRAPTAEHKVPAFAP